MKFCQKMLLLLLFAFVLEVGWFQLPIWRVRLDSDAPKDEQYDLADMNLLNWQDAGEEYISGENPIIYIPTDSMHLYNLEFQYTVEPDCKNCLFFYTAANGEVMVQSVAADNGVIHVRLDENVGPILRVDLAETAGVKLKSANATINSSALHISFSRVTAIVMICVCGSLLFRTQETPDYTVYIQKRQEDV